MDTNMVVGLVHNLGQHRIGYHGKKKAEVTLESLTMEDNAVTLQGQLITREFQRIDFSNALPESVFKGLLPVPLHEDPLIEFIVNCVKREQLVMAKIEGMVAARRVFITGATFWKGTAPSIQYRDHGDGNGRGNFFMDSTAIFPVL